MFLFGMRRFGRMGPLGLAYTGYQLWRRLSPAQKQRIRGGATSLAGRARRRRADPANPFESPPGSQR